MDIIKPYIGTSSDKVVKYLPGNRSIMTKTPKTLVTIIIANNLGKTLKEEVTDNPMVQTPIDIDTN